MGSYTTTMRYYKADGEEVVDVEQQLNYNWDICDLQMKRLLEYEYVVAQNPDVVGALSRSKFYKEYSNSIQTYFKSTPDFFWQDPVAFNSAWTPNMLQWFQEGYNFSPTGFDVSARLIKKSGGTTSEVEWSGAIWELGGPMELNTNVTVIAAGNMPSQFVPTVTKYFDTWSGNTSADFSVARVLIGNDGRMEFKRYGVNPSAGTSQENRVEFTGIIYNVEVTGT